MTHELKKIIQAFKYAKAKKLKTVLVTVVALEGSSYRRPGVRMLIRDDGRTVGAVSGGCVEKEIVLQAQSVFAGGIPKMMTYDGRYRLGCEGILYILIEPFEPETEFFTAFDGMLQKRNPFGVTSYFSKTEGSDPAYGSIFRFDGKEITDFPGAENFTAIEPEMLSTENIDAQTALMIMTHSYVRDLKYLLAYKDNRPAYLGLLGPSRRRERLLGDFIENHLDISEAFIENIHGPAGLNIGAETAQEIALAIIAEILSVTRNKKPMLLKNKSGKILS